MGYSNVAINAANDAVVGPITTIEFYTAAYGSLLGSTAIDFGSSSVSGNTATATVGSTPIADTWTATGTVGSVRLKDVSDNVIIERSDANAVGLADNETAFVKLTSLSATNGGAYNVVSISHSFDNRMENES